jgi:hypothetical protein
LPQIDAAMSVSEASTSRGAAAMLVTGIIDATFCLIDVGGSVFPFDAIEVDVLFKAA